MNKSSAVFGFICAVVLAPSVIAPATANSATAVIMGPTFVPDPAADPDYFRVVTQDFVDPITKCKTGNCTLIPLVTPEELWPITGLNDLTFDQSIAVGVQLLTAELQKQIAGLGTDPTVFFGNSQSATLLTLAKSNLADLPTLDKSRLLFVLLANPNRPNGGLLARIQPTTAPTAGVDAAVATPTDTGIPTIDITFQYDGVADYPSYPSNFISVLNTLAGAYIHAGTTTTLNGYTPAELTAAMIDPANRQVHGDTTYITIPAKSLPLVDLLRAFGVANGLSDVTAPIADLIEPTMRVLVELGYDRTDYGQPQPIAPLPASNQLQMDGLLTAAGSAGLDAVLSALSKAVPGQPAGPAIGGWKTPGTSRGTLNARPNVASAASATSSRGSNNSAGRAVVVGQERRGTPSAAGQRAVASASKAAVANRRSITA